MCVVGRRGECGSGCGGVEGEWGGGGGECVVWRGGKSVDVCVLWGGEKSVGM